jgi:hypothetical protein
MYYKPIFAVVALMLIASPSFAAAETQYSALPQATPLPAAPILPNTGGPSVLPIVVGTGLLGTGLLARRLFR